MLGCPLFWHSSISRLGFACLLVERFLSSKKFIPMLNKVQLQAGFYHNLPSCVGFLVKVDLKSSLYGWLYAILIKCIMYL